MYRRVAACALLLVGCFSGTTRREILLQAVRELNDGVRWSRYDQAVAHIPVAERRRFTDRHTALEDDLEFADYEIQRIDVDSKSDSAEVLVDVSWTLKRRGLLERTLVAQKWEQHAGEWFLVKEERRKGAPLALYDERPRAEAKPAAPAAQ